MKLIDIVPEQAVIPELKSTQQEAVLGELLDVMIAAKVVSDDQKSGLLAQILDREHRGSTGFGRGVAVPHVKHDSLDHMAAAIGISEGGVEFNALDKQPVHVFFLLLSPADRPEEHLQAMEVIFKNLGKDPFRRFLRQARNVEDVLTVLRDADDQQLPA